MNCHAASVAFRRDAARKTGVLVGEMNMINRTSFLALTLLFGATAFTPFSAAQAASTPVGDPVAGEKVFTVCKQCHKIGTEGANFYGPTLNGIVGRPAGSVPGYAYSDANKDSGIVWTEDALRVYLREPQHNVPGTKMTFAGLHNPQDIENVIAYLKQFGRDGKKISGQ